MLLFLSSCSSDDDNTQPESIIQNSAPNSFSLAGISDNEENVDLTPLFLWTEATDPDGDPVTYSLYLDTVQNPVNLVSSGITGILYGIVTPLDMEKTYYWKVEAEDDKSAKTESDIFSFTTRNINDYLLVQNTDFSPRAFHNILVYNDKFWVIGGEGEDGSYKNDVWYSDDGLSWTLVTGNAAFPPRKYFTTTVFDDKMWILGSYDGSNNLNDVWYSTDGVNWQQTNPTTIFQPRQQHAMVVFDDKMWVIDGGSRLNDVWYSEDGVNWQELAQTNTFTARFGHKALVFNDKMWVVSGYDGSISNDVWYSEDGSNWELATDNAAFTGRTLHTVVTYMDKMWLIGSQRFGTVYNDIWYSDNGEDWYQTTPDQFSKREGHTAVVKDDNIWIIGGVDELDAFLNDVWTLN
ncbi:hypothetical protein BWZ22_12435 [Seonamhaeicola sp. S2-3]|uniref:Kelch repeat-containing protein n=1 Tax=Seonamhaeicola sp. S2-3 TaxID=1936081 RepID=UPI000972B04A|nr:hypothetical protein [Seonamhaeicola sp. S2-3]APY11987.1 hypothetical protein BWZ22_12435 [Seonamhaeicola sp. S2-3]